MVKTWNPHSLSKSKSFLKVRARRFFPLWFNMNLHSHWKMSGPSHERNHCHPSLHVQSPQTSPPRQRRVTAKFLLQLFGGTTSEIFPLKFLQIFEFGGGGQTWPERQRHWFITLPCRPNDLLAAVVTYRRPVVVPSRPVGFSWVNYELLTECVWVSWWLASEGEKKNSQMPFRDVMGESLGVVLSSLTVCLQRELIDGWADCCFA